MSKRSTYIDKIDPETRQRPHPYQARDAANSSSSIPSSKAASGICCTRKPAKASWTNTSGVGNKYPTVKLNTTYSFGVDDQDFVVAFEGDYPEDFVELRPRTARKPIPANTPSATRHSTRASRGRWRKCWTRFRDARTRFVWGQGNTRDNAISLG